MYYYTNTLIIANYFDLKMYTTLSVCISYEHTHIPNLNKTLFVWKYVCIHVFVSMCASTDGPHHNTTTILVFLNVSCSVCKLYEQGYHTKLFSFENIKDSLCVYAFVWKSCVSVCVYLCVLFWLENVKEYLCLILCVWQVHMDTNNIPNYSDLEL